MKKLALASAAVLVLLFAGGWAVWSRLENRLVVKNESGQAISFLTITVGGETILREDIPANGSVSARFRIRADDHFAIRCRLADGTEIADNCGYVTNGMSGERAEFAIHPGGKLEFKQQGSVRPY
jgi:hypothetical protein